MTTVRFVLLPFFLLMVEMGRQQPTTLSTGLVIGFFLVICASDYYDGPLARALGLSSEAGKVFDNLADITFLVVTLTYLSYRGEIPWWVPTAVALAFTQYVIDSWLLSRSGVGATLVANPIGHWAGILNYIFTGVVALNAALQARLLPSVIEQGLLAFWGGYLGLAMGVRLRFFWCALRAGHA